MNDPKINEILSHFPGWRFDERFLADCWRAVIIDDEGHGVHLNTQQTKGRYYISGCWPSNYHPIHCPHISVSQDRPAEKIAEDIKRRFLPAYLEAYAEQKAIADAAAERDKQTEAVRQELAVIVGEKHRPVHSNTLYGPGNVYIDVQGPDSIRLECRCNFTLATTKKILALLKKVDGGK